MTRLKKLSLDSFNIYNVNTQDRQDTTCNSCTISFIVYANKVIAHWAYILSNLFTSSTDIAIRLRKLRQYSNLH